MRFYLDTEFIENGPNEPLRLISIGIVCENGRTFYAENADCPLEKANPWVQENVIPHLEPERFALPLSTLRERVLGFVMKQVNADQDIEFWGYYSDYDWVIFAQLFGTMMDLPEGFPMYCRDLKQYLDQSGCPRGYLPPESDEHHAEADAMWIMLAHRVVEGWMWEHRYGLFRSGAPEGT